MRADAALSRRAPSALATAPLLEADASAALRLRLAAADSNSNDSRDDATTATASALSPTRPYARARCALPSSPSRASARAAAEDTVTGFLLAGIGQRDAAGANFLVVDAKMPPADVAAFFDSLLARGDVGLIIVSQPVADSIRATVVAHTATIPMVRRGAAQRGAAHCYPRQAGEISRRTHTLPPRLALSRARAPQVLEIPSTQSPYDPNKDQLMKRVLQMLGEA